MKSSDEMIRDLYKRRERYQKDRRIRQEKRMKVMLPVACACIVAFNRCRRVEVRADYRPEEPRK